eukprot:COSAG06_NODE_761_length_12491_cov_24.035507_2_plen_88_part_00
MDGHLNFEHDTMLGSSASYGQGIKPAVLIVIDPREYEAYHGHWPHHLFFLLPESNRGIGYALRGIYVCHASEIQTGWSPRSERPFER